MGNDHESIRKLCFEYSFNLDEGDFESVAELLADAELRMLHTGFDEKFVKGAEAIRDFYASQVVLFDGNPRTRHVITNQLIEVDADGESATSRSYFTLLQSPAGADFSLIAGGQYHDVFVKRGGNWRFRRKTVQADYVNDARRHFRISREFRQPG